MGSSALLFFQQKKAEWQAFDAMWCGDIRTRNPHLVVQTKILSELRVNCSKSAISVILLFFALYIFISQLIRLWRSSTRAVLRFAFALFISCSSYGALLHFKPITFTVFSSTMVHTQVTLPSPVRAKVNYHPPCENIFSNLLMLLSGLLLPSSFFFFFFRQVQRLWLHFLRLRKL